jgi:glycosyltransferase involved in cell wall biosynthesis
MHNTNKTDKKKKKFLHEVEKKIKRASHVTFISSFTKEDVQQYIDLTNKPATVIYNGCNIEAINDLKEPLTAPQTPFLFTIGTITDKKNFHVLPVLLAGNDRLLIIAGITQSEAYKQLIIQEAIKYKVEKRVIFTGPITENDKQWYLKNCEAFVFPSLTEGFGLPVVEAMYFGKPIFYLLTHRFRKLVAMLLIISTRLIRIICNRLYSRVYNITRLPEPVNALRQDPLYLAGKKLPSNIWKFTEVYISAILI